METPTEQFSQTVIATRLGPDVSALADAYLERTKYENAWALMWFEYLCEHRLEKKVGNGFGNAGSKRKRSE